MPEKIIRVIEQDFTKVQVGDTVVRSLAGVIDMDQVVVKVDDDFIYTGFADPENGWRFWRRTGFEYDPDLMLPPGVICSFLKSFREGGAGDAA